MRGIVHYDTPPKLLLRDWLLLQNHRAKIVKILFLPAEYIIQLENCIFCYIIFDINCISRNFPDSSRAGAVQFINLKSYDEDCLLRQCFTISTTTNKTVTQTQVKPFCLSKVDSFLSFMILTVFPHGYRKWFPCRLSPPYSLWLQFPSFYSC